MFFLPNVDDEKFKREREKDFISGLSGLYIIYEVIFYSVLSIVQNVPMYQLPIQCNILMQCINEMYNEMYHCNVSMQCINAMYNAMYQCNVLMQCNNAMYKCNVPMQCTNAMYNANFLYYSEVSVIFNSR